MNQFRLPGWLTACLFLLTFGQGYAQLAPASIDSLVEKAMTTFHVAGAAVAVIKDGKIVHEKGYGVRSVVSKLPVDVHTNFQIASNSKAFTTTALAILVDEGKLSWKDKVTTYIPEFKMYNDYVTENFLVEDLLTHRSGLGLGAGDLMEFPDGTDFSIKDVLTNFQYFKPVSAFRTQFDYDNQLYLVAGELIARVSGMSWEKFVQARIVDPLQMTHTYTTLAAADKINMATPHATSGGLIRPISFFSDQMNGGAGGMISNVDDMAKWMLMHLHEGKYGPQFNQLLVSAKRHQELWTMHTVMETIRNPRYTSHFNGYGLGWDLQDIRGNLLVSHTGGLPGMLTSVTLVPDLQLGIIVLTNTEDGGAALFSTVRQTILDSYLGLDNFGWTARIARNFQARAGTGDSVTRKVWAAVAAAKNTAVNNDNFTGVYEDKWFGKVNVFMKNNQLWFAAARSPKLNGALQFYNANTFAVHWAYQDMPADALVMFTLDENGNAQGIRLKGISPNIDFSFDFQDLDLRRIIQ